MRADTVAIQPFINDPAADAGRSDAPSPRGGVAVSVVIVSYNTRAMTLECLAALYTDIGDLPAEVFVVDNGSTDGSPAGIVSLYPQVRLIANAHNVGFGVANNQAMAEARGDYILLLNSDAFVEPGAVGAMIRYLRGHPEAALVGPRILNVDSTLQKSCFRFPSPVRCWMENLWVYSAIRHHPTISDYTYWLHDHDRDVDFVIGACLMVRRTVVKKVGVFDPSFFMYSEEIDWQRRIRSAGWEVAFTPNAKVKHLGGGSGAGQQVRIKRHFFDSLDVYELKHHGVLGLISMRMAMLVGCSLRAVLWALMFIVSSKRRSIARQKVALHLWLVRRQSTHWKVDGHGGLQAVAAES